MDTVRYEYCTDYCKNHSCCGLNDACGIEQCMAAYKEENDAYRKVQVFPVSVLDCIEYKCEHCKNFKGRYRIKEQS